VDDPLARCDRLLGKPTLALSEAQAIRRDELDIPSGKLTWLWNITIFYGKTHYKWPFSIAMLNYQRVWLLCISSGSSQFLAEEHHVKNHGWIRNKVGLDWLRWGLCGFQHMANFGAAMTISDISGISNKINKLLDHLDPSGETALGSQPLGHSRSAGLI